MRKIIINADDFGMSAEVNRGIKKAILNGPVSSTSLIVNLPEFEDAAGFLKKNPKIGQGVHLNLTEGQAVSPWEKIFTLVDKDGQFFRLPVFLFKIFWGQIKIEHLETEIKNQIKKFQNKGLRIDHLDAHQHIHLLPPVFKIVLKQAQKLGIISLRCHNVRFFQFSNFWPFSFRKILVSFFFAYNNRAFKNPILGADSYLDLDWGGPLERKNLLKLLNNLPGQTIELACHPALITNPQKNPQIPKMIQDREKELELILSKTFQKEISKNFQKTHYGQIK